MEWSYSGRVASKSCNPRGKVSHAEASHRNQDDLIRPTLGSWFRAGGHGVVATARPRHTLFPAFAFFFTLAAARRAFFLLCRSTDATKGVAVHKRVRSSVKTDRRTREVWRSVDWSRHRSRVSSTER